MEGFRDVPVYFARVLEESQGNRMNGCIAPSLVKEPACAVEVVEVVFVRLTSPEFHVCDLKVRPEMTSRIPVGFLIMIRSPRAVRQPLHRVVAVYVLRMRCEELLGFGPQSRESMWRIVQVDGEAVRLVVVLHVPEHVVVDVAEEMDFRFHTPVVPGIG